MEREECVNQLLKFLDSIRGRLSFRMVERLFSRGLDENPIFEAISKSGALAKNVIIILGGRGCGKTLVMRYIKHYFEPEGWDYKYFSGDQFKEADAQELMKIISETRNLLENSEDYKVIVGIDDVVEASEATRDTIKNQLVPLAVDYAGRIKLVISVQSERVVGTTTVLHILEDTLGRSPKAEMLFGEYPGEVLGKQFRESYVRKDPIKLFRGAAMINLDAYWSRFRSLDMAEELADVIIRLAEFYKYNSGVGECREVFEELLKYKRGLALIALASMPKTLYPYEKIVIEYISPEPDTPSPALNGLGISDLIYKFISGELRGLSEAAERLYSRLSQQRVTADVDDIKEAIMESASELAYASVVRGALPEALGIEVPEAEQRRKRKPLRPRLDFIYIDRVVGGQPSRVNIIIHVLKPDAKGYVVSSSLYKLARLVELNIPSEAEGNYLAVIVPSRAHMRAVYRYVEIKRIGRDILVVLADSLGELDNSVVKTLADKNASEEELRLLRHIFLGTTLFNLRDNRNVPQLIYYLAPTVF
ncbi:ATP-binding protein [Aeropyrum pernix]|uniref:ATP-binding protein n=1 Tax=Aeropyrum pernix TaxID=56636 RepID=UPI00103736F0|nr:ATP-binding protein [Aeropyrum pernix]